MSNQEPSPPNKSNVSVFREYFSSILALLVVGAFLAMVGFTLPVAFNGTDEALTRAKDLLTLVSPFAGMVIGYYFNKATSDARAESAEKNAQAATQTAQKAAVEKEKAESLARKSEEEIKAMRTDLLEMWGAANDMVHEMPRIGGDQSKRGLIPASGGEEAAPDNKTMWKLQEALKRAEKWK
ncbi:MAG: hypothetical protein HUU38_24100 [Anaerolineales bacterium]|nr:hypothetical protein [Anaerolineales bacterium]